MATNLFRRLIDSNAAWLRLLSFLLISIPVPASAQVLIPVANRRDHVFDDTRNILYISTSGGTVERYDVATNTLLSPFIAGTASLNGIDITLDDQFVYVADGGQYSGLKGAVRKFDANTGNLTSLLFDRKQVSSTSEGEAWDIVVTNNNHALLTTNFNGSGSVPLRRLDLSSDTFSQISSGIGQRTSLQRSPSGDSVLLLIGNTSPGPIFTYNPATQTFPRSISVPFNLDHIVGAVNRNGTLFATGGTIYDSSLVQRASFPFGRGVGFSPTMDVLFGVDSTTNQVVAINTNTFAEIKRYSIGEAANFSDVFGNGKMSFSGDGRLLFLSTSSGVRMLNVQDLAIPEPSTLVLAVGIFAPLAAYRRRRS